MAHPALAAVHNVAPLITKYADEAERERRLARPVVDALLNAGVFRLLVPPALGGAGASPLEFAEVVEAVSAVDGSTGWCVMIGGGYGHFAGLLPPLGATEIFSDSGAVLAGTFRSNGIARAVADGYHINGQWPLASGSSHATWLVGGCRVFDGDQPRLTPTRRPELRLMLLPVGDAEILDTWHTAGLRGTASHDFVVRDRVIPAHRTFWFTHPPARPEPVYRLPVIAFFATCIASVPLGIARHALSLFKALAGAKTPTWSQALLRDSGGSAGHGPSGGLGAFRAGDPDRNAAGRLDDGERWRSLVVGATRPALACEHAGGDAGCPGRRAALYRSRSLGGLREYRSGTLLARRADGSAARLRDTNEPRARRPVRFGAQRAPVGMVNRRPGRRLMAPGVQAVSSNLSSTDLFADR